MAKKRRGPVKKSTLHLKSGGELRAAAARMQSKGDLWKKRNKVRTKGEGTEKKIHFYTEVDRYRAKVGGKDTKSGWLKRIRSKSMAAIKAKGVARKVRRKAR